MARGRLNKKFHRHYTHHNIVPPAALAWQMSGPRRWLHVDVAEVLGLAMPLPDEVGPANAVALDSLRVVACVNPGRSHPSLTIVSPLYILTFAAISPIELNLNFTFNSLTTLALWPSRKRF